MMFKATEFTFATDAAFTTLPMILFELLLLYFSVELNPLSVLSTHTWFGTLAICAKSHCGALPTVPRSLRFGTLSPPLAGLTSEGRHRSGFWVVDTGA